MCLPFGVFEPIIERARAERLIEVRGATGTTASSYRYGLTDLGRDRARQYLDINQYIGAAPVPLAAYVAQMRALAASRGYIDRDRLRSGFSHLVVPDRILEQLGPAVNAQQGDVPATGSLATARRVIGEGLGRTIGGEMYMPHAIDVDGHIITMFDPINHEPLDEADDKSVLIAAAPRDRRWVRIRRPVVIVGGELTLDMLDLTFNPASKFYEAPLQLKANGGVFLVDDFGRQRIRPEDLLNRWIVPLESRVDYLTLHTGKKFQVPFDVLVVFATNLDPASLADEAFLRRIPYKIAVERSVGRGVHAHLRDELPPARPEVPPGDGGLPAPAPLPARRASAARVPAARPARSGRRALCRYRGIEPDDHARAARRRLCVVLPRIRDWRCGIRKANTARACRFQAAGHASPSERTSRSYDPRARAHGRRGRVSG